jgi:RNA polymerase sigma factor (TIGR02999 family)
MNEMTSVLSAIKHGEPKAANQLLPLVYDELRKLAAQKLAQEKPGQTLQATALVHEVCLRLVDTNKAQQWNSRGHFFAAAAEATRRILVDTARRKRAEIHRGDRRRIKLAEGDWISRVTPVEIIAIDESLARLAEEDAQAAELVKLRPFAGMSVEEAARCLGLSRAKAYRLWRYARARLLAERQDWGRDIRRLSPSWLFFPRGVRRNRPSFSHCRMARDAEGRPDERDAESGPIDLPPCRRELSTGAVGVLPRRRVRG